MSFSPCKYLCVRVNIRVFFLVYLCRIQFYPVLLSECHDSSAVPCVYNSYIIHSLAELDWPTEKMARVVSKTGVKE